MKSPKAEVQRLRKEILGHNRRYYSDAAPSISDEEYDRLLEALRRLEEAHPELRSPDSPTQKVGGTASKTFRPAPHSVPMLSLDNSYSPEDILEFHERVCKILKRAPGAYVCEPKIDGVSLNLVYEHGRLKSAATRGDGRTGEDVTANVRMISSIPPVLGTTAPPSLLEVRGEVFLFKSDFDRINKQLQNAGAEPFVNARNCASGSLRQKNPEITGSRNLRFYVHSYARLEGEAEPLFHSEFLKRCRQDWGLPVAAEVEVFRDIQGVLDLYSRFKEKIDRLQYEVDGLVAKVDKREEQRILGATAKSPRWAMALKYPGRQATTTLESVEFSVGRTGTVTPVAKVKPVFLSGVTISSVTLHNFEEVERLDARIGDTVVIERAGEVIPKVVKVVLEKRPRGAKPIRVPRECPVCGGPVRREEDAVAFRCTSPACPAQLKRSLLHFASRDGLDIEGFGDAVVEQLVGSGRVRSLTDVFSLTKEDLLKLDLFAEKRALNLLAAVQAAKSRPLSRLLYALGIPQVGEKTARDLAAAFREMPRVVAASREELLAVPDVGPVVADSIAAFFEQDAARRLVDGLAAAGLSMREPETAVPQHSRLAGKTFVFTGELESMTRPEAEEKVRLLGAKASGSVSKKTSFVVVGAEAGSKAEKAKKLGVATLTESEFLELLK